MTRGTYLRYIPGSDRAIRFPHLRQPARGLWTREKAEIVRAAMSQPDEWEVCEVEVEDAPLFPGYEPPPTPEHDPELSAGQRLTLRQAANVAADIHPLISPDAARSIPEVED